MATWWRMLRERLRWYELAPEATLLLGLGVFAATEPHAATAGLRSTKAIALIVGVGAAWLAMRAVTTTLVTRRLLRAAPFAIAAVAILKVVVLPAYDDHTVVEALPTAPPPASSVASSAADVPVATVDPAPIRLRTAMLTGIDHRATGDVRVYAQPSGGFVVGLEDFDIQPGPAYALYVVRGVDRHDRDDGVRIASLRGNRGTQYYDVSADTALTTGPWTVLVWCETFDVPVANATPA